MSTRDYSNFLILAATDSGGAALAGLRIRSALLKVGKKADLLVARNYTALEYVKNASRWPSLSNIKMKLRRLFDFFTTRRKYYFVTQTFPTISSISSALETNSYDVIMVLWTEGIFGSSEISRFARVNSLPVVVVLLDMGPLTGGCHYTWNCVGYQSGCDNCAASFFPMLDKRAKRALFANRKNYEGLSLSVWAPTKKLAYQASNSFMYRDRPIIDTLLGCDLTIFSPTPFHSEKASPLKRIKKSILIVAEADSRIRKGFALLVDALTIIATEQDVTDYELIVLGPVGRVPETLRANWSIRAVGYASTDAELAARYRDADIFVSPSIEDAGPMMVCEAICCGTPVVAYDVGVAPQLIVDYETGMLATVKTAASLATALSRMLALSSQELEDMRAHCCRLAENKLNINKNVSTVVASLQKIEPEGLIQSI